MPPRRGGFTQQKIDTFTRQKCIQLLEKLTKNMFRMFRDEETSVEQITERFFELKKQIDALGDIALNSDYHREMKKYVEHLAGTFSGHFLLEELRSKEMSKLNSIQKIKNKSEYSRKKRR